MEFTPNLIKHWSNNIKLSISHTKQKRLKILNEGTGFNFWSVNKYKVPKIALYSHETHVPGEMPLYICQQPSVKGWKGIVQIPAHNFPCTVHISCSWFANKVVFSWKVRIILVRRAFWHSVIKRICHSI